MVHFFYRKTHLYCKIGESMRGKKEYLSYPFLYEKKDIVDFELATDELTSYIGFAASFCDNIELKSELLKIAELVYHLNPCVRKESSLEESEIAWLHTRYIFYLEETKDRETLFVLPSGFQLGSILHVLRSKSKKLVRLLHKIAESNIDIDESIFDFSNILANYFFTCSLYANKIQGYDEIPFKSRLYK